MPVLISTHQTPMIVVFNLTQDQTMVSPTHKARYQRISPRLSTSPTRVNIRVRRMIQTKIHQHRLVSLRIVKGHTFFMLS